MPSTPYATTQRPQSGPTRHRRWAPLRTLPARTVGIIVLGELAYLTVAGPGALLLQRLAARLPLPAHVARQPF